MRAGGRGLLIVRAFTDEMFIEFDDGCIVVRCERSIRNEATHISGRRPYGPRAGTAAGSMGQVAKPPRTS